MGLSDARWRIAAFAVTTAFGVGAVCGERASGAGEAPNTIVIDGVHLAETKARIAAGDPAVVPAYLALMSRAEDALELGPWSVMDKPYLPPSGNRHDFLQIAPFAWPNPATPDGLPWIQIDGLQNPENEIDAAAHWSMSRNAHWMSLAYFFTGDDVYAERAAMLYRTWYVSAETYMTPRIEFVITPGVSQQMSAPGSAERFMMDLDGIRILAASSHWTATDQATMESWATSYLNWLMTSPLAAIESQHANNHSDWFDVHPVLFALFIGDVETARSVLERVGPDRIAMQIEPDGTMPFEITRSDSLHYHEYTMRALISLAEMARHVDGVDLWSYETPDGRGLRATLSFMEPYSTGQAPWPYFPGSPHALQGSTHMAMYRRAALGYWESAYEALAQDVPQSEVPWIFKNAYAPPPDRAADVNDDWRVDFQDLASLLATWGPCAAPCPEPCDADVDGDCDVGFADLTTLLTDWDAD